MDRLGSVVRLVQGIDQPIGKFKIVFKDQPSHMKAFRKVQASFNLYHVR